MPPHWRCRAPRRIRSILVLVSHFINWFFIVRARGDVGRRIRRINLHAWLCVAREREDAKETYAGTSEEENKKKRKKKEKEEKRAHKKKQSARRCAFHSRACPLINNRYRGRALHEYASTASRRNREGFSIRTKWISRCKFDKQTYIRGPIGRVHVASTVSRSIRRAALISGSNAINRTGNE